MRKIMAKLLLVLTVAGMMAWITGCESEGRHDRDDYYGGDRGYDHGHDSDRDRDYGHDHENR